MDRNLTLRLAQTDYVVPMAPIKRSREWRVKLRTPLNQILDVLSIDLSGIEKWSDIKPLAEQVLPVLMDATDTLLDLIFAYAPTLKADKAKIENEGYDDEVVDAFLIVLGAAVPLGKLTSLLGRASQETSTNSPEPSGDSTQPTLTI